jgi:hypothetical protein
MNVGVHSLATSANMYQTIQLDIPGEWNLRRPFYENANPALCTSFNVWPWSQREQIFRNVKLFKSRQSVTSWKNLQQHRCENIQSLTITIVLFIVVLLFLTFFLFFNLPYSCRFLLFFPFLNVSLFRPIFSAFSLFYFFGLPLFNFFISFFPSFFLSHFSSFCSTSLQFLPPPYPFLIFSVKYHVFCAEKHMLLLLWTVQLQFCRGSLFN